MKATKGLFILLGILFLFVSGYYWFFIQERDITGFSLAERQWIEENKNRVIDLGVVNNIPLFTATGEGIFFSFLEAFEKKTELAFNKVPFTYNSEIDADYKFVIKRTIEKDDILLYQDNYVILSQHGEYLNDLADLQAIDELIFVVQESDQEIIEDFFVDYEFELKVVSDYSDMFATSEEEVEEEEQEGEQEEEEIVEETSKNEFLVVPKTINLPKIVASSYQIVLNLTNLEFFYVLELGEVEKLNSLLTKYYQDWEQENYQRKFYERFNDIYFSKKEINEKDQLDFRGKRYDFGFVSQTPYHFYDYGAAVGINILLLEQFAEKTGIEIRYHQYDDMQNLEAAFNNGELDLISTNKSKDYEIDALETNNIFRNSFTVIGDVRKNVIINSLADLRKYDIAIFPDPFLESLLNNHEIEYEYFNRRNRDYDVVVLENSILEFYRSRWFADYYQIYQLQPETNSLMILSSSNENEIFRNYFNFYLSFIDKNEIFHAGFLESYDVDTKINYSLIAIILASFLSICFIVYLVLVYVLGFRKGDNLSLSKENKLKYIDLLTSLKNRNFLNDNIEKWDNCEVYPQAILVLDLNNVAYVNDNYGHVEGDNLIKEAANLLIANQEENSEIIRTSGNEFLIYIVGADEKKVSAYVKKLQKEMEKLNHGFGATIGYSVIESEMKTVDDAINEATIDMRNKKVLD